MIVWCIGKDFKALPVGVSVLVNPTYVDLVVWGIYVVHLRIALDFHHVILFLISLLPFVVSITVGLGLPVSIFVHCPYLGIVVVDVVILWVVLYGAFTPEVL